MKLSVIVPSLTGDVPETLRRQAQGAVDVELVVVKGVSPVGKARNVGLERAQGEYVAWVDADDEVADGWLDGIIGAISEGADVVTLDAELVGWTGLGNCVWGRSQEDVSVERLLQDVYRDVTRQSSLWLYVSRKILWTGLRLDEEVRIAEDYLVLPHLLMRAKSCRYLPRLLYRYHHNAQSLINTQNDLRDAEAIGLWERRLAEAPPAYRGDCLWGVAMNCYWLCDRVAVGAYPDDHGKAVANARRCAAFVRRSFGALLREAVRASEIPLRERAEWAIRFACVITGFWFVQRWRRRSRRA